MTTRSVTGIGMAEALGSDIGPSATSTQDRRQDHARSMRHRA